MTFKIGYFADGPWAHRTLERLIQDENIEVVFICARYSSPDPYLRLMARNMNVDFIFHENVNERSFILRLERYEADLFISMSFDQIMRQELYTLPKHDTINCHAGKLPYYRGRNILNWALINDEKEFGVTAHYIDDGIDTGDIILQEIVPIDDNDTYATLLEKAYVTCPNVLMKSLRLIMNSSVKRQPQSSISTSGLICCQRRPGDEIINWNLTSRQVFNFVRALTLPGPCASTKINGSTVKIMRCEEVFDAPSYLGIPGSILAKVNNDFLVKTGDSYIKLVEWDSPIRLRVGNRFQ